MSIGIPYAMVDPETGERICPVCGERIPERYDRDGEQITFNYAEHYERNHEKEE